jgi:hypothetical protein
MSLIGVPVAADEVPALAAGLLPVLAAGLVPGLAAVLLLELLHPAASAAMAAMAMAVPIFISRISD